MPRRKNRKGRSHKRHNGHGAGHYHHANYRIRNYEHPRAHEKDEADRYHDTGVPHDLEREIHRSTDGLEGDNFYRKHWSSSGKPKKHHDFVPEHLEREIHDETYDIGGGHYADQFESKPYHYRDSRDYRDYRDYRDQYDYGRQYYGRDSYPRDHYESHHVLRRADDVLRSV